MKLLMMPVRTMPEAGVLTTVWATDGALAQVVDPLPAASVETSAEPVKAKVLRPETAFYRRYTEAMLRRYAVLSMESGRVPSMLGREMFRGRVTSYRVHGFDDVVIFVHDVEQSVRQLGPEAQRLLFRIGVQEYTFAEVGAMLHLNAWTTQRRYYAAVDALTAVFLRRKLLDPARPEPCQETENSESDVSG